MTKISPGRPRDAQIDAAIAAAVLQILGQKGYRALTMDGIARRAGVPRTSVYRRWPSKQHLVANAIVTGMGQHPAADTGSLAGDLRSVTDALARAFSGPVGRALPALVSDLAVDSALARAFRKQVLAVRRESMRAAFARAAARGEVAANLDIELLLDMLTGPFYFRTLFGHAVIQRGMAGKVVESVLRAAGCRAGISGRRA